MKLKRSKTRKLRYTRPLLIWERQISSFWVGHQWKIIFKSYGAYLTSFSLVSLETEIILKAHFVNRLWEAGTPTLPLLIKKCQSTWSLSWDSFLKCTYCEGLKSSSKFNASYQSERNLSLLVRWLINSLSYTQDS